VGPSATASAPKPNCVDGWSPEAALIQATNGNLYGAVARAGANGGSGGTIFEITTGGTLTTLYNFCSQGGCTDGDQPYAGVIQATNPDFYGTTAAAGANGAWRVFEVTSMGRGNIGTAQCDDSGFRRPSNIPGLFQLFPKDGKRFQERV
jgi:hypothetical protein